MSTKSRGFTLVEVLVISPVVILFIGVFISLLVSLTGESLVMREKNAAIYNSQATLDDIETSIAQATSFLTTTGTVALPQGREDYDPVTPASTTAFTNTGVNGHDALIIQAAVTNKSPNDSTRKLIYTGTGACDSKNPLYTYMIVYFVALDPDTADTADKALYKRTIVPPIAACDTAWQRNSCNLARRSTYPTVCKANDEKLVSGISTFDVSYYIGSNAAAEADSNATQATDVSVNLGLAKQVAGNSITQGSNVRTNSVNVQAADSSGGSGGGGATAPPANPPITNSRNATGPNPYRTTFSWGRVGNANSYVFRYNFNGGAWVEQTVAQPGDVNTQPSFNVEGTSRKQAVNVQVDVVSNVGTYSYGTGSATATPRWNDCTYQNGWSTYGSGYSQASFTKTSSGIVGLRGLVRNGTMGQTLCTLPVGFRPKFSGEKLIFQVAGYQGGVNSWARVDVLSTGEIVAVQGENPWVSLDGIMFLSDTSTETWTANTWQNGWSTYGAGHSTLRSTFDSIGRVHVQGLGSYPGTAGSTVMTSLGASKGVSNTLHAPAMSGVRSAVNLDTAGNVIGRGSANSYQQLQFIYHPSSFSGWNNLPLYNSYQNYGGGWPTAKCYKGSDDVVIMTGLVNRASSGDNLQMSDTVAAGCGTYTDGHLLLHAWYAGENPGRIDITNGAMIPRLTSPTWTSLDGVRFIAD